MFYYSLLYYITILVIYTSGDNNVALVSSDEFQPHKVRLSRYIHIFLSSLLHKTLY